MAATQPKDATAKKPGNSLNRILLDRGDKLISLIGKAAHAPIYLINNLLKADQELVRQNQLDRLYSGPMDVASRLYAADGIQALWRGFLIALPGSYINPALNLLARAFLRPLTKSKPGESYFTKFIRNIAYGTISAVGSLLVIYPFRVTSFKYMTDVLSPANGNTRKYSSLFSVWKSILTTDGISGLYAGIAAALVGVTLYRAVYFALYELYVQTVRKPKSSGETAALTGVSAFVGMSLTFPLSVMHDRMMIAAGNNMNYGSTKQLVEQIWQNEGLAGFFRGYLFAAAANIGIALFITAHDFIRTKLKRKA